MKRELDGFFRKKTILITGGLGFLGSNLAHRLIQCGSEVTLLDSLLAGHGGNLFNIKGLGKKLQWRRGDIRNKSLVESLVKNQEILFNIAAQTSHTNSMDNPFLDVDINTKGQIIVLEACRKINPSIRIIYCSTRAIYGSNSLTTSGATSKKIVHEETLPNPLDIYSANKLAGENYHKIYSSVHGLNATILRVANGYGPRAQMRLPSFGILNWFIRLAVDDREIKIFGDGKQVRDYVYVDDIVNAFLMTAASNKLRGEVLNVGSGKGVPLIDIVAQIVRIGGKGRIVHVPWPEKNKKIDVGDFVADVKKIKRTIGWNPQVDLKTGLKKTINFYRQNRRYYW